MHIQIRTNEVVLDRGFCDQGEKRFFKWDTCFAQAMTQFLLPLLVGAYASFTIVAMVATTILGA